MKLSMTVTQHAAGAATSFFPPLIHYINRLFPSSFPLCTFNLHSNTSTLPTCVFAHTLSQRSPSLTAKVFSQFMFSRLYPLLLLFFYASTSIQLLFHYTLFIRFYFTPAENRLVCIFVISECRFLLC